MHTGYLPRSWLLPLVHVGTLVPTPTVFDYRVVDLHVHSCTHHRKHSQTLLAPHTSFLAAIAVARAHLSDNAVGYIPPRLTPLLEIRRGLLVPASTFYQRVGYFPKVHPSMAFA